MCLKANCKSHSKNISFSPEKNGLSLTCSGPSAFSVTFEAFVFTKNQMKKQHSDILIKDCKQVNKNGSAKQFETHYTMPKFLTNKQYPLTIG